MRRVDGERQRMQRSEHVVQMESRVISRPLMQPRAIGCSAIRMRACCTAAFTITRLFAAHSSLVHSHVTTHRSRASGDRAVSLPARFCSVLSLVRAFHDVVVTVRDRSKMIGRTVKTVPFSSANRQTVSTSDHHHHNSEEAGRAEQCTQEDVRVDY